MCMVVPKAGQPVSGCTNSMSTPWDFSVATVLVLV
jgi:hypothetical protein